MKWSTNGLNHLFVKSSFTNQSSSLKMIDPWNVRMFVRLQPFGTLAPETLATGTLAKRTLAFGTLALETLATGTLATWDQNMY